MSRSTLHAPRPTLDAPRPTPQSAVALVITLVLLSVITFMAVTFLVVSRAQHGAVATVTDQQIARFAAETATQRAMAELLAPIMATTNEFNYGLLVSANYITPGGFISGLTPDPLNVNYNYANGTFLKPGPPNYDLERNLANLLYNPRPPVFVVTNAFPLPNMPSNEFRCYLDLNRNGAFDPSGLQPVVVQPNPSDGRLYYYDLSGTLVPYSWPPPPNIVIVSNFFIGDPQWIGGLQRPEFAHSPSNYFTHRYAYLVVPASQTLDVNTVHNYAKKTLAPPPPTDPTKVFAWPDGFLRNQGVLTAEINLAAFLDDLNTNVWPNINQSQSQYGFAPYFYNTNLGLASTGVAADDAASFVRYRYATNVSSLANVLNLYKLPRANAFTNLIDAYSEGPLMTDTWWPPAGIPNPNPNRVTQNFPWAGADNPNHFYTTQDLFDRNKFPVSGNTKFKPFSFVDRLWMAGTNIDSYNRYTFYSLLSQLGTDSAPEPGGKMNVNYCNVDNNGYVVPNMATNFTPWQPAQFFTNAAIRLLADAGYTVGYPNSVTNILVTNVVNGILVTNIHIPIWPTNYYTASVNRLFQLAANMYDATTNRNFGIIPSPTNGFPTVFRPLFLDTRGSGRVQGGVFINGYAEPTPGEMIALLNPYPLPHDLSDPNDTRLVVNPPPMVYGIPLVIGAKKGYPNFNKFAMQMQVQVTRKLQFHRPSDSTILPVNEIDQMFMVGVSNIFGVDAWNSYGGTFPRPLQMVVYPDMSVLVTNLETGHQLIPLPVRFQPAVTASPQYIPVTTWPGFVAGIPWQMAASFITPLTNGILPYTNHMFLTNAMYSRGQDKFVWPYTGVFERTIGSTNFHVPQLQITLKTRLRFALFDLSANRIVDYVNLAADISTNLNDALVTDGVCGEPYTEDGSRGSMWCTNRMNGAVGDSIPTYGILNQIAASMGHILNADWNNAAPVADKATAINFFKGQFIPGYTASSNSFNAPYQPFRNIYLVTSWQANDPLVHYTIGDLTDARYSGVVLDTFGSTPPRPTDNLGSVNSRYEPWGGFAGASQSPTLTDLRVKDPLMMQSDNWDFPTAKLPNAGWLGRVHRGTPWQTVYLKPFATDLGTWRTWTANPLSVTNFGQLQTNTLPLFVPGTFIGVGSDAFYTQPTNDWHLLDLFTTALNDNATRGQMSINQTNLAAWSAVLSGVIALTNAVDSDGNVVLSPQVIQPAGVYDAFNTNTWPPLVRIVKRINDFRSTNSTRHVFSHLSDLLAVPELTVASPFLNTIGTPNFANNGLNDAAYERIPQQIAGLLKVDSVPRFVIYAFGQTLKPESNRAIVKNGPFIGLCTNYQIVAEAATRTVVRFEGVQPYLGGNPAAITNLHPVVESFTVLPPD